MVPDDYHQVRSAKIARKTRTLGLLQSLSAGLSVAGCAVGWNPTHAAWDIWARRGSLSEAKILAVVEHHGGPKRLARVSAVVRPSIPVFWIQAILGVTATSLEMLGFFAAAALLTLAFCVLWVAAVLHANRLELAIVANTAEAAQELQFPKAIVSCEKQSPIRESRNLRAREAEL